LNSRELVAIYHEGEIGAAQKQLRETRARQDIQCLSRGDDTMTDTVDESHHVPDSDAGPASQMPYTQAFGTQIQHPIRTRAEPDELQIIGVNRLEPVLAGNTKRDEIRQGATNTDYEAKEKLLSLLGNPSKQGQPGFVQSAFARPKNPDRVTESSLEPPTESLNQNAYGSSTDYKDGEDARASSRRMGEPGKEVLSLSKDKEATESAPGIGVEEAHLVPRENSATEPECAWMKGFIFNRETLEVPQLQKECLEKNTSWLKPQPGYPPFQDGNMPQSILERFHRIADERASLQDGGNSDIESDIDPSPDSIPVHLNLSAESALQTTQDDDDSSSGEISWDTSPVQSPQKPANPHQGLPPDSSPDIQNSSAEQPSKTFSESLDKESRHLESISLSVDKFAGSQPSTPAVQNPADSDDEMETEMEEFVPQALGEDLAENLSPSTNVPVISSPKPTRSQSIVQVRETPYGKGKTAQRVEDDPLGRPITKPVQNSSGESKDTSSTSVIHSTYDMPNASSSAEIAQSHTDEMDATLHDQARRSPEREETHLGTAEETVDDGLEDVQMVDKPLDVETMTHTTGVEKKPQVAEDLTVQEASALRPNTTLESAKWSHHESTSDPPSDITHTASRSAKRKLETSPAKSNRRHSKRREIKIVGFGDSTPVTMDPVARLREEREESLRRFREQRNSSTSFEGQPEPKKISMAKQNMDAMDLDKAGTSDDGLRSVSRSPRHQSLYDEPSPIPVQPTARTQSRQFQKEAQFREEAQPSQAKNFTTQSVQTRQASVTSDQDSHATVFESFKAAYPEYKGDTKHFHNQCKDVYTLDLEDKMVPKWQWDDFIIRNRTDYRDYAMECIDRGEHPEPYHRFYKDNIRDTLYRKGIIEGRKTLERALDEVGMGIEYLDAPSSPSRTQLQSQKSLPGSFSQTRKSRQDHITTSHVRPRQSLPTSSYSHHRQHHHQPSSSASKQHRPRQQANPSREISPPTRPSEAQESTGDPFRDYYFAIQRSTSWTGSNKVSVFSFSFLPFFPFSSTSHTQPTNPYQQ
jgi:hypothetical protein